MKVSKYISVIALALVFAVTSCVKLGGDLVECEGEHTQEEVGAPEASMMMITGDVTPGGGITDPDHDEDHDRDEEKVVVTN